MALRDLVAIVEAGYRLVDSDHEWLDGLVAAAQPSIDGGMGVYAFLFDATRVGSECLGEVVTRDADPECARLLKGCYAALSPAHRHMMLRVPVMVTASEQLTSGVPLDQSPRIPAIREGARAMGFRDLRVFTTSDGSGPGCRVTAVLPKADRVDRRAGAVWSRIGRHVAAGLRLRHALAGRRAEDLLLTEQAEAVLDAEGRLLHATPAAQSSAARRVLRDAVRAVESARGTLRHCQPMRALETWQELIAGRWSLIDRFESDGRRFVVAVRNDPVAADPRGLTARERAVAAQLALGSSNKLIAWSLHVCEGTVAALVNRILRKLGAGSRGELVRLLTDGGRCDSRVGLRLAGRELVALSRPRPPAPSCLTPRQEGIARAAAQGRSNAEISVHLGRSPRTIAHTLSSVYRKLGVGSRAELAHRLAD